MDTRLEATAKFKTHMEQTRDEMLDIIDNGNDYSERYDVMIIINDKLLRLEMDADIYSNLEQFVDNVIKQEFDDSMDDNIQSLKLFASYREHMICNRATLLGDRLTFQHNDTNILNPFMDETGRYEVNPYSHYGKDFVESAWHDAKYLRSLLEPVRIAATEFLQATDPNGCYLDEDIDDVDKMSFLDVASYFAWYANSTLLSKAPILINDAEMALKYVTEKGMLDQTLELMFALPTIRNKAYVYKNIWQHNVTGFIAGLFRL